MSLCVFGVSRGWEQCVCWCEVGGGDMRVAKVCRAYVCHGEEGQVRGREQTANVPPVSLAFHLRLIH